jgi:carboxyl-terminal processing protease
MRTKYFGAIMAVSIPVLLAGCGKETKAPNPAVAPAKVLQSVGQGQYQVGGVGAQLLKQANEPAQIKAVVPGSPSARAGLKAGLVILAIDDTPTAGKSLADCVNLVRGAAGTGVKFTVVDPEAGATNQVLLTRETITFN